MRLPFGLDFKSIVITALFIYFVLPFILSFVAGKRSSSES